MSDPYELSPDAGWSRFVLDASIALRWCFGDGSDSDSAKAAAVLNAIQRNGAQIIVPPVWPLEIGNVIVRALRSKQLDEGRSIEFLDALSEMPISIDEAATRRAFTETLAIASNRGLTTYDASYLELAAHEKVPLATLDEKLAKAAVAGGLTTL